MIEINIWLYSKPYWELDLNNKDFIDVNNLREHTNRLNLHLHNIANNIEILQNNGWKLAENSGPSYSLTFSKKTLNDFENAKKELIELGIDLEIVDILEWDDMTI